MERGTVGVCYLAVDPVELIVAVGSLGRKERFFSC